MLNNCLILFRHAKVHRVKLGRATTQSLDAILSPAAIVVL